MAPLALSFNSNLVRLSVDVRVEADGMFWSFNSNLVRLSDGPPGSPGQSRKFQFQSGAITRRFGETCIVGIVKFQFQSGAIKRRHRYVYIPAVANVSIPIWCD